MIVSQRQMSIVAIFMPSLFCERSVKILFEDNTITVKIMFFTEFKQVWLRKGQKHNCVTPSFSWEH